MERRKQLLPLGGGFSQMILQGVSPVCLVTRDDLPGSLTSQWFLTSWWARGYVTWQESPRERFYQPIFPPTT
ncbi:MAG: hypothetical protein CMJ70_01420 [Planctomycetaceae bacterium]|nr:hypothetical protein [Planctomycetaceae bacterium]